MTRLHRSNDFQRFELGNLRRRRHLRMFDAQAKIFASVGRFHVSVAGRLLGAGKGIERHLHSFIANRVKANLEARQHALFCHIVQLLSLVAGQAGVLRIIRIRLEQRSRSQVERGLVAETQDALKAGVPPTAPVLTGIGYAEALAYIRGELTPVQLPAAMAQSNRQYARRQLRWWRRDPRVRWFSIDKHAGHPQDARALVPAILNYLKENGFESNLK